MSRHVIVPPKKPPAATGDRTPAQPSTEAEAKALGIRTTPNPAGTPIKEGDTVRYPVPKGTSVLIGGKSYIAQSDEGITVRGFSHAEDGQPTSVVIIDAPTCEAAAFAAHLVETGQMLSEDEVRQLHRRGLLKEGQPVEPRVHRAMLSQAHREAEWLAHQKKMAEKIGRLEAQLRAAGLEPEADTIQTITETEDEVVATMSAKVK